MRDLFNVGSKPTLLVGRCFELKSLAFCMVRAGPVVSVSGDSRKLHSLRIYMAITRDAHRHSGAVCGWRSGCWSADAIQNARLIDMIPSACERRVLRSIWSLSDVAPPPRGQRAGC